MCPTAPRRARRAAAVALATLVAVLSARAATFNVNSTADATDANIGNGVCATAGGVCTLPAAIQEANSDVTADTIVLPAGVYLLNRGAGDDTASGGDLDVNEDLTISGAGARTTIIDGNALDRVFDIRSDSVVFISGVTVRNGDAAGNEGGGFRVTGGGTALTLTDANVSGNRGKSAGGILNDGTLTLNRVSLSGNAATSGTAGGLGSGGASPRNYLTNVTISGNSATSDGGGIETDHGELVNVTITGNSSPTNGGLSRRGGQSHTHRNVIVAGNAGTQCKSSLTSLGNNLSGDATCSYTAGGDLQNTNPLLGPLQDNGGPTDTHALPATSPANDAGTDTGAPGVDQRGAARPQDGDGNGSSITDMGAYEVDVPVPISGTVFVDLAGDALPGGQTIGDAGNPGASGVTVRVYRDNDDGSPGAGDTLVATVATAAGGGYSAGVTGSGTYWVAVDSKSVAPPSGFNGGFAQGDVWAEQTYGTTGARCSDGAVGTTTRGSAGPCYGGRTGAQSDTASALATAEHVTGVAVAAAVTGVNFGFSFNAVTTMRGGDATDDDGAANRTVQGSVRQFLRNAEAITGANAMRFVPAVPTNASGGGGSYWRVAVTSTLPAITDGSTTVDGRAYSLADGTTIRDDNPGSLGAGGTVGVDALALATLAKPELEIVNTRAVQIVNLGLDIQASNVEVRRIAIYGFGNATHNDAHAAIRVGGTAANALIEDCVVGAGATSFADPGGANRTLADGIRAIGGDNGIVRRCLIGFAASSNLRLRNASNGWLIEGNEFRDGGAAAPTYDNVAVESGGTDTIRGNLIADSNGHGIDLPSATGTITIVNNTIANNGIGAGASADQAGIRLYGTSNVVDRNVIRANYGAGILVTSGSTRNTITRNSIYDNGTIVNKGGSPATGQIGIDLLSATDDGVKGTPPFVTINDAGDGDSGGDDLYNFPVITQAWIHDSSLIVTGFAGTGQTIEFFTATRDASGFGEGRTFLFSAVEGGVQDTDAGTGTYGPGPINGLSQGTDTAQRFTFSVATPPGVLAGTILTATGRSPLGNTSEFSGNATVSAGQYVSGFVYHDANANSSKDANEIGIGTGAWVKLIQAGIVLQVLPADSETGAYSFAAVPNGTYTLIVDNNDSTADTTPTAPTNWTFFAPASGSRSMTVAGADLTGQNFGLTFTTACVCGYDDGQFVRTSITIDGNLSDWASVLADPDNNACDAAGATDRDYPVQSTGRNLTQTAVTFTDTHFYMMTTRTGSTSNTQTFLYYADTNFDGLVNTGEIVVVALWQGNTQACNLELWTYNAAAGGGDPLVDASGFADGYSMPGTLTFLRDLPDGRGEAGGLRMEWGATWADLGLAPGQAINWHTSSTNTNPGAVSLPSQIDDNMGGCGGNCAGSTRFTGLEVGAPVTAQGAGTVYLPHDLVNTGNAPDTFDITGSSSGPWTPVSIAYYHDLGTLGVYDPGVDTLLTDTNANGAPDTGSVGILKIFRILVAVQVPAPPPAGTTQVVTTVTSTSTSGCGDDVPSADSVTDQVYIPSADVYVSKDDGVVSAAPGTSLTYTIEVANAGPDDATGIAVADTFDNAVLDVAAITWTCGITTGTGACGAASGSGDLATTVDLNAGAVATYTVTAPIRSGATGTLSNTATITPPASPWDPDTANNTSTDADTVLARRSALSVSKTDGVVSAVAGQSVTYTIVVTNGGPSDVDNAAVADTFDPAKFDVASISWTCAITTGTGNCDAASGTGDIATTVDLTSGSAATYTVTAPILAGAIGTLSNTVTVTPPVETDDPDAANNNATDADTALVVTSDLQVAKTDGVVSAVPGQSVTYTIVVSNAGPSPVLDAAVADTFDPTQFDVASISWTCAITTGTGNCDAASGTGNVATTVDLTSASVATYTVTAPILSSATGTLSNTATTAVPVGASDPDGANNSATDADTALVVTADLQVAKTDGVVSAVPGQSVTYTIVVTNAGPSDVLDATVGDTFDPGTFDVASISWTCAITAGTGNCDAASGTGDIATTVDLTSGSAATYTVTAPILAAATGTLSNTATVAAPVGTADPDNGNDAATDDDTALAVTADLQIVKDDGAAGATPGLDVEYTITVTNAGPSDVPDAAVSDVFDPAQFDVASVSWTCAITTGTGNCDAASGTGDIATTVDLTAGSVATFDVTAPIPPGATGTLSNTATVTAPAGATDSDLANNSSTDDDDPLGPTADIVVAKTDGVVSAVPGTSITYTITVTNEGPSNAPDVSVSDTFDPVRVDVPSISWTCAITSGTGNCDAASGTGNIATTVDLDAAAVATYMVTVPILSAATGTISNTATASAAVGVVDRVLGNNAATDDDTALAVTSDLRISKTDGVVMAVPGQSVTYTIYVTNDGPSDAIAAEVADTFDPAQFDVPNITWTCVIDLGAGGCGAASGSGGIATTVDLTNGSVALFTATVPILSAASGTLSNTVTVTAAAGTTDPDNGNDAATDDDTALAVTSDLSITKTDGLVSAVPGQTATYTIVVSNAGPSDVLDAPVADTFDPTQFDIASISWTCAITTGTGNCDAASGTGDIATTVDLTSGSAATYTVTAPILSSATGTLSNTATVAAPGGTTDPVAGNNAATDNDTALSVTSDLSITKTDGLVSAVPGQSVTYTIVVTNNGPSDVVGASVADTFNPAQFDVASVSWTCAITGTGSCGAASGTGDIAATVDLTSGSVATFTVTAPILSSATGTLSNIATVTAPVGTTDPAAGNNSATDSDTALGVTADLSITKTDGLLSAVPGQSVTYTIVVTDNGPSDVVGASVADTFDPAQFDVASISWTCAITGTGACGAASGTADIAMTVDLTSGSLATFSVTAPILSSATGTLANTATVTAPVGTTDPAAGNNSATDNDTALGVTADLSITKTDGVASAVPGQSVTYTIVVTNNGPSDVVGASVDDTFDPAQFDVASVSWTCAITGTGTCGAASGTGDIATTVDLASGSVATFTVTAPILSRATGTLSNTATVTAPVGTTDPAAGNNSATDNDTALGVTADLSITKTDGVVSAVPGQSVTYTIVVTNNGPSDVVGASVADTFDPAQFDVASVSWSCAITGTGSCGAASGTGDIATTVDLTSGSVATFSVTAPILSSATATLANTATVTAPVGTTDPAAGNNSATDNDTALGVTADLSITKTDGVVSAVPGQSVTYTIVVTNDGPSDVVGASVDDAFDPAQFDVASVSWTCAITGTGSCGAASGTGDIATTVDLTSGSVATFTVTAPILSSATGTLSNTATVTAPVGTTDPAAGNNSATDNDTALSVTSDLSITKTDGVVSAVPGQSVTYTIVVTNNGPSDVVGASVNDTFDPAQFDVASVSWTCAITGTGSCGAASGTGDIATTVDLTSGSVATFTVTAPILSSATGTLSNTATATTPVGTTDSVPGNNSATDNDTALGVTVDLSVTKTDGVVSTVPGQSVTYTIVVTNNGPSDVVGASVADTFDPAQFDVASLSWTCAITGSGACGAASGTGDIATTVDLSAGSVATFTVMAPILSSATGTLANTAIVTAPVGTTDPAGGNNSATDNDTVLGVTADLSITKTDGVVSAVPGQSVTYTIVVTNSGPSDVVGAAVADTFDPAQFDVASISWTCAITGTGSCGAASGTGDIATTVDLTSGSVATFTVTAPILSSATGTLANTATVTAPVGTTDPAAGNNSATDNDTALGVTADLSITKTDGVASAVPGQSVTYTIIVTNNGPSDVVGVSIADTFDSAQFDVASISWTCAITGTGTCGAASGTGDIATTVDLTSGSVATFTVTAPILSSATGTLSNTATVTAPVGTTDPAAGNNSATDNDTALGVTADLSITKTDGVVSAVPGQSVTYMIVVTNNGPSDVVGASVADAFDPAQFDVASVSWTCAITGKGACGAASGTGNVATTVDLTSGSLATFTVTAPILSRATGTLANTASVTAPVGTTDPAGGNNSATDNDTVLGVTADLSITKTDGVVSAVPGQSVTYTIVVTNSGPSDVVGASVDDTFDPAQFDVASISWTCAITGTGACGAASGTGDITTTVDLTSGSLATFTVTAPILSSATGTLSNTATVTAPVGTTDPAAGNDSATDNDTVLGVEADLSITKTDGVVSAVPGQSVTYTIVVTNNGPSDVFGAPVADAFDPAQFDVASISWTCAITGTGACGAASGTGDIATTADLTSGSVATFTVTAPILSSATGTLANTATVTAPVGTTDPAAGNNSATDNDTALSVTSDLSITKTDGVVSAVPGQSVTYTIVVTNNGPSDVIGAPVADTFDPAQFDVASISWTCAITGTGACGVASGSGDIATTVDLASGSAATFTATAPILSSATGTLSNTATVATPVGTTDPAVGNNSATDSDTVLGVTADLSITKTDGVVSAVPGQSVTYTIAVTNSGPSDVVGASVADTFDPGQFDVASVSWTCAITGSGACGAASGTGDIATTVDLTSGSAATFTVTAPILSSATGTLSNTATVTVPVGTTDPDGGNDSATDNDTVLGAEADLSITKTDGVVSAVPGQSVTYTIVVTNNGPSDVVGAAVADAFDPTRFDVASISWTCAITGTGACTAASGSGDIATTVDLTSGSVATFSVTAPILSSATGTLSNTATVAAPVGTTDPAAGNDSATDDDTVLGATADLSITKTDGVVSAVPGQSVTYTIVVTNNGPSDVVGAKVADTFDPTRFDVASIAWTCAVAGSGACGAASGSGDIATTVDLTSGSTATFTVTAPILSGATGTLSNTATVTAPVGTTDPAAGNNSATDNDTALGVTADLQIAKTDGVTSVAAGTNLTYTIAVTNAGPSDVVAAAVADSFDPTKFDVASISWTCAITGTGACGAASGSGDIATTLDLASGSTATFTVTAPVLVAATGTISNTATVTAPVGTTDPVPGNNAATDGDTEISARINLSLTKTVDNATPDVGADVVFTITVTNAAGAGDATGVVVRDLLPSGYSWVSDDGGGSYAPATGVWTVGALPAGGSRTLRITARVMGSGIYINAAEVTAADQLDLDDIFGDGAGNDYATATTTPNVLVDLSLTKTVDVAAPAAGTNVVFTVTVTNAPGYTDATGVVVTDLLPSGYLYVSDDGAGTYAPATGIWTVGNVPAGTSRTLRITARVLASGDHVNTAEVTAADQLDPNDTYGDGSGTDFGTAGTNPTGSDGTVDITDTSVPGDVLSIVVTDPDLNADPSVAETVVVQIRNDMTGEVEPVTLTETGPDTGVFAGTIPSTLLVGSAPIQGDGVVGTKVGDTVTATYQDSLTSDSGTATRTDTGLVLGTTIRLTKTADSAEVIVGGLVVYTLKAENTTAASLTGITLADTIPAGFKLVEDSARTVRAGTDGQFGTQDDVVAALAVEDGRPLVFGPIDFAPNDTVLVRYVLRVGSGTVPGEHVNVATPYLGGTETGNEATASVLVVADPLFDLATIIGKVWEDLDSDGWQDEGEPGVPRAMVALDDGTYALTDDFGRYHFPAVQPGQRMVKLNILSLPPGSRSVGEDSAILWLTPGLMAKANFGVVVARHREAIGDKGVEGLGLSATTEAAPIEIVGSAETLSAVINGTPVPLPLTETRLAIADIDDVVTMEGREFRKPVRFEPSVQSADEIESWTLTLLDGREEKLRSLEGAGAPPDVIEWDGRDFGGRVVKAGEIYQYQLEVRYVDGGVASSPRRLFGVNRHTAVSANLSGNAFEVDRAVLNARAKEELRKVAEVLRRVPDEKVIIEGHTDSDGSNEHNMGLSRRRSEAARDYLVRDLGLPSSQFILKWFGEERPLAPNTFPAGRALNRRVEIKAETEEIETTDILDQYRATARARANETDLPVGPQGLFSGSVTDPSAKRLTIEVTSSQGQAARATVAVPTIEIKTPAERLAIAYGSASESCRAAARVSDAIAVAIGCAMTGRTDPGNTVELDGRPLEVPSDGTFSASLDLKVGSNAFGLVARNPEGFVRIANLAVTVSDRDTDGKLLIVTQGTPPLTVNLPPNGTELKTQMFELAGATDPGNTVSVNGTPVVVGSDGRFAASLELPVGKAKVVVQVTAPDGSTGSIERTLVVAKNELFLLAFADATIGQLRGRGFIEAAGLEDENDTYTDGRIAYYLKGTIKGKYLITSAFDSGQKEASAAFRGLDAKANNRLLTSLDPDKIYPVYGDNSTVVYDAESQGKFYLALDSETLHAVIGNYPLSLNDTELTAYQRTLYGARLVYRSASKSSYGRADTEVVAFGAEVDHAHARDEVAATGGSLYYLSHREILEGSEEVTLVVRDKVTGLVLSRQRQQRQLDYTIKYPEGRIMFNRPISSVQESGSLVDRSLLSGNPVFIEVDYETRVSGLDKTASGVRVRQQINDHVAVGGTYVKDDLDQGAYELSGVDAELRFRNGTRIVAEVADSSGSDATVFVSTDGGLTYQQVSVTGPQDGSAWKLAAEVDIGEWFGKPDRYQVKAYFKDLDAGFVSSGNFLEQGTRKVGLHADLRLGESDTLQVRHDREDRTGSTLLPTSATNETTTSSVQWNHAAERWTLSAEVQDRDNKSASGTSLGSSTLGAARFWSKLTEKLSAALEHQQTLSGEENDQTTASLTYQAVKALALEVKATDGSRGSSAQAGAVVTLGDTNLYLTERVAEDQAGRKNSTILGAKSALGRATSLYTEYQWDKADAGADRTTSLLGLQRRWDIDKGFKLTVSGETANVDDGTRSARRTAFSTGFSYSDDENLTAVSRNEVRYENGRKRLFQFFSSTRVDYKIGSDFTLLGKYRFSRTKDRDTSEMEARFEERSLGLAYRPVRNDRFNALARYTHLCEQRPLSLMGDRRIEDSMDVLSAEGLYEFHNRIEWFAKIAARKIGETTSEGINAESTSLLGIQRLNFNLWKPIDLGVEYRMLTQRQADDRRQGWLAEIMWSIHHNFRVGGGYNFTDFSDNEFSRNDYSVHGWFIRVQGRY